MAVKKEASKEGKALTKEEKKKARLEAIKNRPAGQRTNSKQIDVITTANGTVETYGYPVIAKRKHIGILTTSVVKDDKGNIISVATAWVPGDLTIKAKKGHGTITAPKVKGEKDDDEESEDSAEETASEAPAKDKKKKKAKKED